MAHTYILIDFGADEEKAQQARHKLEGWKQAFRLDKKLQVKFERDENDSPEAAGSAAETEETPKPKSKSNAKSKSDSADEAAAKNGNIKVLVRLYFSAHEKLSEQRSLDRILSDDLFKSSDPKIVRESDKDFPDVNKQFEALG
jgi:hypothetical protein